MADPVLDAFSETVVAGIELVDSEVPNLPSRLIKALESPEVQAAIKNALDDFARTRLAKLPTTVSADDAKELGKAIASAGGDAVKDNVVGQIKTTSHYKDLDESLKKLGDELKSSPAGIWVEKNKTWLYIMGAGAVLGGAAAMYATRSGDDVAKLVTPVIKKSVAFKPIGSLKLGVGLDEVTFTPSKHTIETKSFVDMEWERIRVRLNVAVTVADKSVTVSANGNVIIPIRKDVSATLGGSYDSSKSNWSLNVGVKVDVTKGVQLGVFAGVGKGGVGAVPGGDAFKAMPAPPREESKTGGFVGLGISGTF